MTAYYAITKKHNCESQTTTQKNAEGNSLVVQWLRLCAFTAKGLGSIPGWGTKIPHAVEPGREKKAQDNDCKPQTCSIIIWRLGDYKISICLYNLKSGALIFLFQFHIAVFSVLEDDKVLWDSGIEPTINQIVALICIYSLTYFLNQLQNLTQITSYLIFKSFCEV